MVFEELVGREFDFYGVDASAFKLDEVVFEAVEDESDGYRSMLASVEVKDPSGLLFFKTPLARVQLTIDGGNSFNGYKLVDVVDGHVWLRLGTNDYDDYYPLFTFDYQPKIPSGV
jgi:hypothetical protein